MTDMTYEALESEGIDTSMIKICKKLRNLAKLERVVLDNSTHRSGLNQHLFDYIEYCGLDTLTFIKRYLTNLQPYMIERRKDQEAQKTFICVIDNLYKISVYIKADARQFEEIINKRFPDIYLQRDAANALQAALKKIHAEEAIVPVSGYRSMEEQTDIYNDCLKEDGEEFTRKYVALPGHSEHQLGLAIDLGQNQEEIDFIRPEFPYEGICDTFRRIAPDYGFIERYSAGKENITGTAHEPWHFRYIGYPHSRIMADRGYALEEYMDFIKEFRENCRLAYSRHGVREFEIYYIPAMEDRTLVTVPDHTACHISGNNMDGFIVTCNGIT